jgi:hypothetical protein
MTDPDLFADKVFGFHARHKARTAAGHVFHSGGVEDAVDERDLLFLKVTNAIISL